MKKWYLLSCLLLVVSMGQTCSINIGVGGNTPLDEADASIIISRIANNTSAAVSATIRSGFVGLRLGEDQEITVNGEKLNDTGFSGTFGATVDAASQYTVTVREPTRGIEDTTISEPADFEITSPGNGGVASLSGFTINWSNPNASLQVEVKLTQTLLDEQLELELDPFTDTGSVDISSTDIQNAGFGQGADLIIRVTKINERNSIGGFGQGVLQARLTKTSAATPGP